MDAKNIQALLTEADGFYSAHSDVMNLVCGLAAALKASEERAEKAEQQIARWEKRCESTDERCRGSVLAQRIAEVAAAGDDAALHAECGGKMHETGREAALRVIEHLRKSAAGQQKRAEKAEHQHDVLAAANLAANKRIVELEQERDAARAELARLTTPRPIAEAPTDKPVLGIWIDHRGNKCVEVLRWGGRWMGALGTPLYREAEYLPLPEVHP